MKSLLVVLFCALSTIQICSAHPAIQIVNGTNAKEGEYPFMVSIRLNLEHQCGGTIINSKHILTAAHCVCDETTPKNAAGYSVQYGSIQITRTAERSVDVAEFICGEYNDYTQINDVAIVKLQNSLSMDIPWKSVSIKKPFDTDIEHDGWVVGWGRLWDMGPIPYTLQKLQVKTYYNSVCGIHYNNDYHICLRPNTIGGICNGDSGGALIITGGDQVGIASFISTECGVTDNDHPNVYAKISAFFSWIMSHSNL